MQHVVNEEREKLLIKKTEQRKVKQQDHTVDEEVSSKQSSGEVQNPVIRVVSVDDGSQLDDAFIDDVTTDDVIANNVIADDVTDDVTNNVKEVEVVDSTNDEEQQHGDRDSSFDKGNRKITILAVGNFETTHPFVNF